jgi:hypothetical protein
MNNDRTSKKERRKGKQRLDNILPLENSDQDLSTSISENQ